MLAVQCALVCVALAGSAVAQTFRRANACPGLGCLYPPTGTEFIAGQLFDIRVEIQAPINGSQPYQGGRVNPDFTLQIGIDGKQGAKDVNQFFTFAEKPATTNYTFSYFEDLYARDNKTSTGVNVIATSYRSVALYQPGNYTATLYYNGGSTTVAKWKVRELATCRKAKNAILFIGDGMTTSMVTAARLLGHKSVNGQYLTKMTLDESDALGLQMTHSLDSYITDSANSATALYSGKKSTVNALNAYTDSSGSAVGNPKFETVPEIFRRTYKGLVGIVSTAYIADATPAAAVAHTSQRGAAALIVEQYLNGVTANYSSWTKWDGPDVLFGGGAENFLPSAANGNVSQFDRWAARGYSVSLNKTAMLKVSNEQRALGLFASDNLNVWLDRNVYTDNLNKTIGPLGETGARDQPGLKEMTLKAIDILHTRSQKSGSPFFMMSEAASIDKQMHTLDYDRALGDLLELDDTVKATLKKLKDIGELENTLVVVTADHGHGFDVFGSADSIYLGSQTGDRKKREAVGTYQNSGLSGYQVQGRMTNPSENFTAVVGPQGEGFPVQWDPRYVYAAGVAANPDHRENYAVHTAPRKPANGTAAAGYYVNPSDNPDGFIVNGTIPVSNDQGVHSLTDVPVFAWGPGAELFRGVMNSPDIAFKIAYALDLGRSERVDLVSGK